MTAYDFVSRSEYVYMIECIKEKKPFEFRKQKRSDKHGFIQLEISSGAFSYDERRGEYYVAVDTKVRDAGTGTPNLWDKIIKDWATYENFIENIGKILSRYGVDEQDEQIRFAI